MIIGRNTLLACTQTENHQAGDVDEEEGSDVSGSDTPSELLDDDDMYDDDDVRTTNRRLACAVMSRFSSRHEHEQVLRDKPERFFGRVSTKEIALDHVEICVASKPWEV